MSRPADSAEPALNREACELALKWNGIVLSELLPVWKVRVHERWPDNALVRDFVTLTAVQVLQARGVAAGLSHTAALREACARLGLVFETVRTRLRRNETAYRKANERPVEVGSKRTEIVEKAG